jgi:hypothetical protein
MFVALPASAQEPGKQTQKNTDGTTTTTEPYDKGGTKKTTENAAGEIVDVVTEEPDATYGAGGTKITLGIGQGPWGDPRTTIWVYKDKSGKVRRMEQNQDLNGEDWLEFSVGYDADGRLTAYSRQVHTGDPENFPEGLKTVVNFKYDKSGQPSAEVSVEGADPSETPASSTTNPVDAASNKAAEIRKIVQAATERQLSILEDLDLGMFQLSIDRADAATAGTPTPSAERPATNPGYGSSIWPPPTDVPPWEIPPASPWETPASNPWQFPLGGFPRDIPPMKK